VKMRLILSFTFCLVLVGSRNLSAGDEIEVPIETVNLKTQEGLLARLLNCLFGKKELRKYDKRTQEHRPSPYEW